MMLGYIHDDSSDSLGLVNAALADLAARLGADGIHLAGSIQRDVMVSDDCRCDMQLDILGDDGPVIQISQSLGREATGCRLDPGALEQAAARILRLLAPDQPRPQLIILNKFGKQEAMGRGMADVIVRALDLEVPVLTSVARMHLPAFQGFSDGMAEKVALSDAEDWCRSMALRGVA